MDTDIIAFIRARLDEIDVVAHAASQDAPEWRAGLTPFDHDSRGRWRAVEGRHEDDGPLRYVKQEAPYADDPDPTYSGLAPRIVEADVVDEHSEAYLRHIALHDPAAAFRDVEFKQQVLDLYETSPSADLEAVVRRLALLYHEHRDYRPEWGLKP